MAIVQDTLHALGITRNYKGYYHTVYAIELVLADEDRLESVIKEIYFVTAQHFGCHWILLNEISEPLSSALGG